METDHTAIVRRYDEAWAEVDTARRREILNEIWADDGVYVDPDVPDGIVGPEGLSDLIETSFVQYPGLRIVAISEVSVLGDRASYRWRQTADDGPGFEGTDFIEFGADGRIERLTGFFDS